MRDLPYSLMAELEKTSAAGTPPVHLWHPEVQKDINLTISSNGTWFYDDSEIKRPRLIRLFASVLRREGDDYFLVTPVEKCRIKVEDAPFQGILMTVTGADAQQVLTLTTDVGHTCDIDAQHPLRIEQQGEQWIPYVMIRDGLEARLNRNVYYQLADLMQINDDQGSQGVWSKGCFFPLLDS